MVRLGPTVRECACDMAATRSDSGAARGGGEKVDDWAQTVEAATLSIVWTPRCWASCRNRWPFVQANSVCPFCFLCNMITAMTSLGPPTTSMAKSTEHLPLLKDGQTISWPISRRDVKLWLTEAYPVVLVLYDGGRDIAYWLYVQEFFARYPTSELFVAGETLSVHVPVGNRVNKRSIRRLARDKNEIQKQIFGRTRQHV